MQHLPNSSPGYRQVPAAALVYGTELLLGLTLLWEESEVFALQIFFEDLRMNGPSQPLGFSFHLFFITRCIFFFVQGVAGKGKQAGSC